MNISLANKKALVGGSSKGLGKAVAMQLAKSGASVVLMARNEEMLKKIIAELPTQPWQQHSYLLTDFSNIHQFRKDIDVFFEANTIDILVNNTQGPAAGNIWNTTSEDYEKAFALLFQTVTYTTMKALEHMKKNGFGRVVNISSVTVKEPLPHLVLSNTIRAALSTWSKTLSKEVGDFNITVNSILTGYFDTERLNSLIENQAEVRNTNSHIIKTNMQSSIPIKRFGDPKEYGYLVTFLVSEQAGYITGACIPIDGGLLQSM